MPSASKRWRACVTFCRVCTASFGCSVEKITRHQAEVHKGGHMNTSEQGLQLLIAREDKRPAAYLDTRGIPTIGIGHTGPEVHMGLVWSDAQIQTAFASDIAKFEAAVSSAVKVALTQNQCD